MRIQRLALTAWGRSEWVNISGRIGIHTMPNQLTDNGLVATDKVQLNVDVTVSEISGTPASGGVEAIPDTGREYFYSLQLIGSNFLAFSAGGSVSLYMQRSLRHMKRYNPPGGYPHTLH